MSEEIIDLRKGGVGFEPMDDIVPLLQTWPRGGGVTALRHASSETKQGVPML